ncbi:MAG: hypothetical protein V4556_04595 [Bacteroidota bacterium]
MIDKLPLELIKIFIIDTIINSAMKEKYVVEINHPILLFTNKNEKPMAGNNELIKNSPWLL